MGGWVYENLTKPDRVGGLIQNGHFLIDVIMQWPLILCCTFTLCSYRTHFSFNFWILIHACINTYIYRDTYTFMHTFIHTYMHDYIIQAGPIITYSHRQWKNGINR